MNHTQSFLQIILRHILSISMLCVCAFTNVPIHAQNTIYLSSDQGLSNTRINSIFEDNHKNVWIGTSNGLNRYDGVKINRYYNEQDNPNSVLSNYCNRFINYDADNILIGGSNGIQLYNYPTGKFYTIPLINKEGKSVNMAISDITRLDDGRICICVNNRGCYILKQENKETKKLPAEKKNLKAYYTEDFFFEDQSPLNMIEDRKRRIWIRGFNQKIYVKDKGVFHNTNLGNTAYIAEGSKGIYITTDDNKLYRFGYEGYKYELLFDNLPIITNMRYDNNGNIIICTDGNGFKIYNEESGQIRQSAISSTEYDLATSNVKDVMLDRDGNIWIGIYWKGVIVQSKRTSVFQYIGRRSPIKNIIGTNCLTAIESDGNNGLWVATDHCGLYHISTDGTKSQHWGPKDAPGVPETITAIHNDRHGTLWLGSSIGKLTRFNIASQQFSDAGLGITSVYAIDEDSKGNLWIGTGGDGVYRYNIKTQDLDHYTGRFDKIGENHIIYNKWVMSITVASGRLYVGTADGLEVFAINKDYTLQPLARLLRYRTINTIRTDNRGKIWLGTSNGLYCIEEKGFIKRQKDKIKEVDKNENKDIVIKEYTEKDNMPDNFVNSIEFTGNNQSENYTMCISTDNGLTCMNPIKETFTSFYVNDGIQANEFSKGVSLFSNGLLYFGGINGLTIFDPIDIKLTNKNNIGKDDSRLHNGLILQRSSNINQSNDSIRIVDFFIKGEPVYAGQKSGSYTILDKWISDADRIDLCCDDNSFIIEVSAMTMQEKNIIFEYQVNDGDWLPVVGVNDRISFDNMKPGTYNIKIRAVSYDEQSPIRTIKVVIHQPWYNSFWLWLVYILLFAAAGYFIYRQIKEHQKAKRILENHHQIQMMSEMRMQFFMNISHEIRTPMTLIMAPLERLKKMGDDELHQRNYKLIEQNSNRILQLINQLMDVRKIEKGQFQLHYSRIELVTFIYNLYELFCETAKTKGIEFEFIHDNINKLYVCVDTNNFDKIIVNLLSNAFKFTPDGGQITISLEESIDGVHTNEENISNDKAKEPVFIIKVTDNGIGIPDDKKAHVFDRFYQVEKAKICQQSNQGGTGIGLNLASLLTQLHEGTLTVSDNPKGKGTCFTLTMPEANYLVEDEEYDENNENDSANENEEIKKNAEIHHAAKLPKTIVVADDENSIREYIAEVLKEHMPKYEIHQCSNGKIAWEYIQRHSNNIVLVISDIMMPEMDGNELCSNIKQSFLTNHIPVILLTAKVTDQEKIEGLQLGTDAYITKPFSMDLLTTTIDNLISNRRRLQSKYENLAQEAQKIENIELTSPDEQLMQRVMKIINDNLRNPELSVELIAREVGLSRVHFHRKLKELTNETPRDFIRGLRLRQAARLLSKKALDIGHVAEACGFRSISTFSTTFKSVYGVSPKDYTKNPDDLDEDTEKIDE